MFGEFQKMVDFLTLAPFFIGGAFVTTFTLVKVAQSEALYRWASDRTQAWRAQHVRSEWMSSRHSCHYVILDHGDRHYSYYWHLKNGSVAVKLNQAVKTGTQIGLTGASGCANGPHVHFESRFHDVVFEPYVGTCRPGASQWVSQVPLRHDLYVRDFCFSRSRFSGNPLFETNTRSGAFPLGAQTPVFYRTDLSSQPANSTYRVRFLRPDGTVSVDSPGTFDNNPFFVNMVWYWFTLVNLNVTGTWRLLLDINDQTLIDAPFEVVSSESQIVNRPPNSITTSFDPPSPRHLTRFSVACKRRSSSKTPTMTLSSIGTNGALTGRLFGMSRRRRFLTPFLKARCKWAII